MGAITSEGFAGLNKALGLDERVIFSKEEILEHIRQDNTNDIYYAYKLCDFIRHTPRTIHLQNLLLEGKYNSPEEYTQIYNEMVKKYHSDKEFKQYANVVVKNLSLTNSLILQHTNSIIYELMHDVIKDYIYLEPEKVYMNFHLLQSWIRRQKLIDKIPLTEYELKILKLLVNNYSLNDIVCFEDEKITIEQLQVIVEEDLMKKFQVKGINELTISAYLRMPHLYD